MANVHISASRDGQLGEDLAEDRSESELEMCI
jgi:hypothetical protein